MAFGKWRVFGGLAVALAATAGCAAGDIHGQNPLEKPTLLALSDSQVVVGQSVDFYGGPFAQGSDGHADIHFQGSFKTTDGKEYPVDLRFQPHWVDAGRLLWSTMGPFTVPFVPTGDAVGTFTGNVTAINVAAKGGDETPSDPLPLTLTVAPSIIAQRIEPVTANCSSPVKRLLGGYPYNLTVQAIGFDAVNFSYEVSGEPGTTEPRLLRHPATGNIDKFGDDSSFGFAPVPSGEVFYAATLRISALDKQGQEHSLTLPYAVHNPIEYINAGPSQVAEMEEPVPQSGCIAGGAIGTNASYTETKSDTRSRQVSYNWNQQWTMEHSSMTGGMHTETNSTNVSVSHTNESGWTSNWSVGANAGGGFGLGPIFVQGGVSGDHSWGNQGSMSDTYVLGHDYSVSDTESWAYTQSESQSISQGAGSFWEVSSTNSTSIEESSQILPAFFGVWYRQTTRIIYPGEILVYDLCGAPQVVATATFTDFNWAVALAQGGNCPPYPKSTLPPAQCIVAPCATGN
jgi:hypothetical protein